MCNELVKRVFLKVEVFVFPKIVVLEIRHVCYNPLCVVLLFVNNCRKIHHFNFENQMKWLC
jgi:hypothetical protein